jgi:hypothetical protein
VVQEDPCTVCTKSVIAGLSMQRLADIQEQTSAIGFFVVEELNCFGGFHKKKINEELHKCPQQVDVD